jgi:hypothetical protein
MWKRFYWTLTDFFLDKIRMGAERALIAVVAIVFLSGCVARGFGSHHFVCPDGSEAALHDLNGVAMPDMGMDCATETDSALAVAREHRMCAKDSDCFGVSLVQAPGCFAFSSADKQSLDALRSIRALDNVVCPVASRVPFDCGQGRCLEGTCVIDIRVNERLSACRR